MINDIVKINSEHSQAKYRQIIQSIISSISSGVLKKGDKVPSINEIANEYNLSRDTVIIAFNELKQRGILVATPGKGYFVGSDNISIEKKLFLLFDEFNTFKEEMYYSLIDNLNIDTQVDIFFHHFDINVFETLIRESIGHYSMYAIMPANVPNPSFAISQLPKDKVIIIDRKLEELNEYPVIYQDFSNDLYLGLKEGLDVLQNYNKLILVYPGGKEPKGFVEGFTRFCVEFNFQHEVVGSISEKTLNKGEVYILPNDNLLIQMVKRCWSEKYKIGEDIGIISINESALKEVVANGISTISTDFKAMGKSLAYFVDENIKEQIQNPFVFTLRNSL